MRRREFIQASPDQLSYETRSRRSRPTICWAAPMLLLQARLVLLSWYHCDACTLIGGRTPFIFGVLARCFPLECR